MPKTGPQRPTKWNKENVLAGLRDFYGHPGPANRVLERDNPPLIGGARRVFGSLKAAMAAAGLPYPPHPHPDRETIVAELRRIHAEGKDLSLAAAQNRKNGSLLGPALHRFGSWRRAIEAAGIDYAAVSRVRAWNRQTVLRSLRKWHESRREMGGGSIQRQDVALWAAAKRHFGSYQKAVEAAGIQLPQPAIEWTWPADQLKDAILAELRKI
jgi:hypothetical protein